MKAFSMSACAILVSCVSAFAATPSTQPAADAFEKMKSLAGDWKGKDKKGGDSNVSYKLTSGNSAVMETLDMHGNMVTMYTLDNARVLMTHYCVAQNQPRMASDGLSEDGKTLKFKFLDATGMKSSKDGHMHSLAITFKDDDHITQEWTFNADGKDQFTEVIELERVKK